MRLDRIRLIGTAASAMAGFAIFTLAGASGIVCYVLGVFVGATMSYLSVFKVVPRGKQGQALPR